MGLVSEGFGVFSVRQRRVRVSQEVLGMIVLDSAGGIVLE